MWSGTTSVLFTVFLVSITVLVIQWNLYLYKLCIYIYINLFLNILDIQDDEVAETVYRDRKRRLPLELTVELTEETFNETVVASDSIVLFYAGCEYEPLEEGVLHIRGCKVGGFYFCILYIACCRMT